MSLITPVMLIGVHEEDIKQVNEWLLENDKDRKQQLQQINMDEAGGNKFFTTKVWAAAFNYLPAGFEEFVTQLEWPKSYDVKLLIEYEWDDEMRMMKLPLPRSNQEQR